MLKQYCSGQHQFFVIMGALIHILLKLSYFVYVGLTNKLKDRLFSSAQ